MPRRRTAASTPIDEAETAAQVKAILDAGPRPKLFAFDLDYTLWPAWVDTHVTGPMKRDGKVINRVVDRHGQKLSFYDHVPAILLTLASESIPIAAASRTSAPTVARQALTGLVLNNAQGGETKSIDLFKYQEIYPGSKITHFNKLHRDSGIAYEDMIFFDDEHRNAEVQRKLGVHFVEIGAAGLDLQAFESGMRGWREGHAARAAAAGSNGRM